MALYFFINFFFSKGLVFSPSVRQLRYLPTFECMFFLLNRPTSFCGLPGVIVDCELVSPNPLFVGGL